MLSALIAVGALVIAFLGWSFVGLVIAHVKIHRLGYRYLDQGPVQRAKALPPGYTFLGSYVGAKENEVHVIVVIQRRVDPTDVRIFAFPEEMFD